MSPSYVVGLFAVSLTLTVHIPSATAFTVRRTTTIRSGGEHNDEDTRVLHLLHNDTSNISKEVLLSTTPQTYRVTTEFKTSETVSKSFGAINEVIIQNTTTDTVYTNFSKKKNDLLNELATIPSDSTDVDSTSEPTLSSNELNTNITISKKMTNMKMVGHNSDMYDTTAREFPKTETNSNPIITSREKHILRIADKPLIRMDSYSQELTLPPWKKYSIIVRNRSQSKYMPPKVETKHVEIVKDDVTQAATSLRDTLTSDIPSLEKLKNDLLSATSIKQNSRSIKEIESDNTDQIADEKIDDFDFNNSDKSLNHKWDTFESKRAGFLDLTNKNKEISETTDYTVEPATFTSTNFENDKNEHENSQNETIEYDEHIKTDQYNSSKIYEERADNDYEQKNLISHPNFNTLLDYKTSELNNVTEDKSQNKMVHVDKSKNASLYTVSPNYKPLKKLEVQPPKSFVRDPDDNSWRNESISSLGIVFKPKNSSKPFTQVLKNKTEIEWNGLLDKYQKNDVPDLRERLEQMTKMRKTKRKKTDSMGNVVYVDYEENSSSNENVNPSQENIPFVFLKPKIVLDVSQLSPKLILSDPDITSTTSASTEDSKNASVKVNVEQKHKNKFKLPDYYENADEDETDYLNLAKIDIKKFTVTQKTTDTPIVESTWPILNYEPTKNTMSDRKGTIQYFPPLTTKKSNRNFNTPKTTNSEVSIFNKPAITRKPVSYPTTTIPANNIYSQYHTTSSTVLPITNKATTPDIDMFLTQPPKMDGYSQYKVINDNGNSNKGSYFIKSYTEYVNEGAKDYHRDIEYLPHTESSLANIRANKVINDEGNEKDHFGYNEDSDYDAQFRKDILNRFVENFNSNSERFKPEFPVIFNSSIVHHSLDSGQGVASSRSFLRGLYEVATKTNTQYKHKPYDPNCENVTVELQPAYELQYYLPDQEEKEEVVTLPFHYKL